jgi:hypothetical protein
MDVQLQQDSIGAARHSYHLALSALRSLPDGCALDLGEVAKRIGADKLELIQWMRADIKLARLLEAKLTT